MKLQSSSKYLLGTASVLALLASAASTTPAHAQASAATRPIYFGGSTLASEAFRQIFDCYTHGIVGSGTAYSDGFTFGSPAAPGVITTACSTITTTQVNGLYAGVGSGNGVRGFIANNAQQWYGGTITPPASGTTTTNSFLPALQPSLIDYANTGTPSTVFGSYPYPRVDAGLSDSPLAIASGAATLTTVSLSLSPTQGWTTTGGSLASITVNSTTVVASYNPTAFGPVIQIPAFEVNVAIAVNTGGLDKNHSAVAGTGALPSSQGTQGAAIQLTAGQLCAIFSGLVTDWNDTTASKVPYLQSGTVLPATNQGQPALGAFNDANGGTDPYASTSKAIKIAYRSDGSGTSFILTNYLHHVCPLLDPNDNNKYVSIFGATNLPSTSFSNLISNVNSFRTGGSTITATWIGVSGSAGVASAVSSNDSTKGGIVGYVSADFTKPYTTTIAAGVTAPLSAALLNEDLRINGTTVPNTTSGTLTFIAPTPAGALNAWNDSRLQSTSTTWTWADFNIYNNTFTVTTTQGGLVLFKQSVLPLTNKNLAYPLSGTTFLDLYSCYSTTAGVAPDANRVTSLVNFLTWFYSASDARPTTVMQQAGFNPVPTGYASLVRSKYLGISSTRIAAAGTASTGCSSATGAL